MAILSRVVEHSRAWVCHHGLAAGPALVRAGERLLDLAFPWPESHLPGPRPVQPPICQQCGEPYAELPPELRFTCGKCAERRWYFEWARAGFWAEGQVLEAVIGFKYGEQFYRLRQLGDWLLEAFARHAAESAWDALVPVPLHPRRHRERGFNQAQELARYIGKRLHLPVWPALVRRRETATQTQLRRAERWENLAGAFAWNRRFDVRGRRLLLIDDVFTTGATTNACARALTRGHPSRLAVLTIARS